MAKYKLTDEHLEAITWRVSQVLPKVTSEVMAQYQANGRSPRALRADLLSAAGVRLCSENTLPVNAEPVPMRGGVYTNGRGMFFVPVYDYANDDHVDSVVRRAIRKYALTAGVEGIKWAAKA